MQTIEIYTTPFCGYCLAAKRLLNQKKAPFHEIDLSKNPDRRKEMQKRAEGGRTVPQIFIGELHIGGCDELYQLEQAKKLDALLNAA
ncbi:MAG TPA: glutaredoxin 3 [Rhodobacteraceae bacterium]|jgi:glutaredoxin 3|nr:glutaredoxin 3 [Paracoccaceae bacterium]